VDEARQDGRFQLVTSRIIDPSKNQELRLDWRVAEGESGLKIIDVVIEGVSMSITQRQEYASVIQNNGGKVQALIDALNKQMAALK
jgi:phospholipid transport system substrate-binding protein